MGCRAHLERLTLKKECLSIPAFSQSLEWPRAKYKRVSTVLTQALSRTFRPLPESPEKKAKTCKFP